MSSELPPVPRPLGVFPKYFAQKCETMLIKEHVVSLSGDSFTVQMMDTNAPLIEVNSVYFSLSNRKEIKDMEGNVLFCLRKKRLAIFETHYAEDPEGKEIFEIAGKFSST